MRNVFCFLFVVFFSCTFDKKTKVFNKGNLQSFYVTVSSQKDTIFRTPKGAVIQIKKGTFATDQEMEIKEAYTMKDILLSGLVTESNGIPLRTGGMIYINTKSGESVFLQQPITVLLPANGVETDMQLFKGEESNDTINWVPADTLESTVDENTLVHGKENYVQNCASCHAIRKKLGGPALEGFWVRGPWTNPENILRWVHNPAAFIPKTKYTKELQAEYGQIMPSFPQLSEMDVFSIIEFVRNESQKIVTDTFALPKFKADTAIFLNGDTRGEYTIQGCKDDTSYLNERDSFAISSEYVLEMLENTYRANSPAESETMLGLRKGFTDPVITDGAYEFQVKTLGWYNIDAFVKGLPGTELCELNVQLSGEETELSVYAFFPTGKNLSVGSRYDGVFHFEKIDGKIPLFPGEKGMIIAFGNRRDKFYYGITHFKVQQSQTIKVNVQPSSEEQLLNLIREEKIEGINMDITKQKMVVIPCPEQDSVGTSL
jgi:mono/diheme cytochrome c family protein